jgi:hypothetical protein
VTTDEEGKTMTAVIVLCIVAGLVLATPIIRAKRAIQRAHQIAQRGL